MDKERFDILLRGWLEQKLQKKEIDEFAKALNQPGFEEILGRQITKDLTNGTYVSLTNPADQKLILENLQKRIKDPSGKQRTRKIFALRWVAAASVLFAISFAGYYFINKRLSEKQQLAENNAAPFPISSTALLTLPDGSQVRVDTMEHPMVLEQYDMKLTKLPNEELVYEKLSAKKVGEELLSKVENPKGSKPIKLKLTDGTMVWLNSESSISYPMAFNKETREVSITGEAYFEVTKKTSQKFWVRANKVSTEVLGTQFNIRAYDDEQESKVTLLEGAINVYNDRKNKQQRLKVNQQARVAKDIIVESDVNIEDVMAWKNEILSFNGSDIKTIMKEIGRWYNLEVVFVGKPGDRKFTGTISRNTPLEDVLKILKTSNINFKIENNTIVVTALKN